MRAVVFLVLTTLLPAAAVAAPPPVPLVDYAVTMRMTGMDQPIQIRHRQGVQRMEMPIDGARMVTLHDLKSGQMTMLQDHGDMKMAMVLDRNAAAGMMPLPADPSSSTKASRVTEDKVAGHACTVWRMEDGEDATESCVTSQGILLRVVDPAKKQTIMEATALSVAPQDPTHFVVPPGYQRMQMPGAGGIPAAPRGR